MKESKAKQSRRSSSLVKLLYISALLPISYSVSNSTILMMPPHGWPSRACFACKAKRVKCDETSPSCQRCLKAGLICPGYRPESELIFRDMNSIAKDKVTRRSCVKSRGRVGGSSHPPPAFTESRSHKSGSKDSIPDPAPSSRELQLRISHPMGTNWQDIAIPRFFADYVFQSHIMVRADMRFLPVLCAGPNACAPLKEALNAVAWLSLSNQLNIQWLAIEAFKAYTRAVQLMVQLLGNAEEAKQDASLATNFLFGLFEMISGFKLSGNWSRYRHHEGRVSLVRLRDSGQFTSSNLFRISYTHITLKSIAEHTKPSKEAELWLEAFPRNDPPHQLARCNLRTARLCASAQELFDNMSEDNWWIVKMLQVIKEGILIDLSYQEWSEALADTWRHRIFRSAQRDSGTVSDGFPQHLYGDVYVAFMWNNSRATRIHLHEVLLRCNSLIQSHPSSQILSIDLEETVIKSSGVISEMISDICSSVAFCLGDVTTVGDFVMPGYRQPLGGYLMLWPLWIALMSVECGTARQAWIRGKLQYISSAMGIRAAQSLVDRANRPPWDLRSVAGDG